MGDPIEAGAALAVLHAGGEGGETPGALLPLELQAAKSRLLHTEPAAGAVGLAALAARLGQAGSHGTLHLRTGSRGCRVG